MPRWIPNLISVGRIGLVPVWVALAVGVVGAPTPMGALAVLGLIGGSDLLDGWIARRYGLTTPLGAALDAVADKLAQIVLVTLLALAPPPGFVPIPVAFLGLLVLRDAVLIVGFWWVRSQTRTLQVEHRWHGKVSSSVLFGLMAAAHLPASAPYLDVGFAIAGVLLIVNTAMYGQDGIRAVLQARRAAA